MNTMNSIRTRWVGLAAALLLSVIVAGCGGSSATDSQARKAPSPGRSNSEPNDSGPIVAIISDVSLSTKELRVPDGIYEQSWMDTAGKTAMARGSLWATAADGRTLSSSIWHINGHGFKEAEQLEGNKLLGDGQMRKEAEEMRPIARKMLAVNKKGSDLIGGFQVVAELFGDFPDRQRALVMLTDGGITTGGITGKNFPMTASERKATIKRLKDNGMLPDLTGGSGEPVRVWLGGLGHDIGRYNTRKPVAVIAFWKELIPAMGGELVSVSPSSLNLIDFP